ncbi:hypothetical protein OsJ_02216 [Oryza sativa Japonica Group]|uniref:Uncharacterized protein n=1 Tax=Oryza sativa subsp. japonica TaxID=39947 RepID=B9EXJ0_ORYSJ|nr:hypothetical protein OsJ_02216 [Oryza sativa Japonica Group]
MGKYMRQAKVVAAAVMELAAVAPAPLGVRTRTRSLALQKRQGGEYLELRSRRLEKLPPPPPPPPRRRAPVTTPDAPAAESAEAEGSFGGGGERPRAGGHGKVQSCLADQAPGITGGVLDPPAAKHATGTVADRRPPLHKDKPTGGAKKPHTSSGGGRMCGSVNSCIGYRHQTHHNSYNIKLHGIINISTIKANKRYIN